jgi:hypothetical protein
MGKVDRVVEFEAVEGWSLSAAAEKAGWVVINGTGSRREDSDEMATKSKLRLVEERVPMSEYEPISAAAGITPWWIQAMWLGSVLIMGWSLYLVSVSG